MNELKFENLPNATAGSIVAANIGAAAVFEKHGLDFCCGGNVLLSEACGKKNININEIISDLRVVFENNEAGNENISLSEPDKLVSHIVNTHHAYLREKLPLINGFMQKVVKAHSAKHAELIQIAGLFEDMAVELVSHMRKEEMILFPLISRLSEAAKNCAAVPRQMSVRGPINVMEAEHSNAGDALSNIRQLSGNYTIPDDACYTFRALYYELQALEKDLHIHIHLENNVLFPNAITLEDKMAEK